MTPTSSSQATRLTIDGERLWQTLMELATIGATPKGGCNRQALTDLDRQGRELLTRWCEAEGLTVRFDAIGNLFARRPGRDDTADPVVIGSHIDTQPTGGKFDGCFGVLAALEVIRTLNAQGIETQRPLELVSWTNEEGCRFSPCMMGSGVFVGQLSLDDALARRDAEGISAGEALEAIGYVGDDAHRPARFAGYLEAHIEQGPILEDEGDTIGVVTGALGIQWFDVTLTGMAAHSGSTPMHLRRNALLGATRVIEAVDAIAMAHQPDGRGTVGACQVRPNSRNVIPGEVTLSVDLRHSDGEVLDAMVAEFRRTLERIATEGGLELAVTQTANNPPQHFDTACIDAVRRAAQAGGHAHRDIVSGAGHDAVLVAGVAPTAMIFIPCEKGISHNEAEYASPEDVAAGADVLLHATLELAGRPGEDA
ncbi:MULTISPECIES: Zn-dependent hydrolase [unclassified Modicisalibacter]|uniref:Zn-dependent hydrolase n=1 Tax=unclassified Modicisalibacter TaxID=2679913 RepID=UPI001CCC3DA6|nr:MULTISPECIES: Zn-dependent hydrolase [unclassified Modicisalibacter]MBZ9557838.1 Zn-dependent hydrolase [Modicisalibacter sp. R2A 31.J]MBZ9573496.1 Zn-dependent hydrolase [Modicisalibacter sp. MOD 31.J]